MLQETVLHCREMKKLHCVYFNVRHGWYHATHNAYNYSRSKTGCNGVKYYAMHGQIIENTSAKKI